MTSLKEKEKLKVKRIDYECYKETHPVKHSYSHVQILSVLSQSSLPKYKLFIH